MSPPSRSVAWLLLVAAAAAVLLTGLAATATIITRADTAIHGVRDHWSGVVIAATLTLASLGLRALRFIFLLRRSGVRIPIRDAYIGYLSGFSLLLAPLLLGELLVRAYVLRVRVGVPPARTIVVNLWERFCDAVALALIVSMASLPAFSAALALVTAGLAARLTRTWSVAMLASIAAWLLPGLAFWFVVNTRMPWSLTAAQISFAWSSLLGGLTLAPGGIVVTGQALIDHLRAAGLEDAGAAAVVVAARVATVGFSTALGVVMLVVHFLSRAMLKGERHFDRIARVYDAQIPAGRREALLTRKTSLMHDALRQMHAGRRGLDVGCGQGWYVARMRSLGWEVEGIDTSAGQLAAAQARLGDADLVRVGSALAIPAAGGRYDFVYTINVLHHLPSVEDQQSAFREIARVLKPGEVLFVHEINTRNPVFRFYMGYLFPTLNCIDEGVERWLLPHRLAEYTPLAIREVRYFTFLPDFLPQALVRLLSPLERRLEASRAAAYSAHYMAVLQKPA